MLDFEATCDFFVSEKRKARLLPREIRKYWKRMNRRSNCIDAPFIATVPSQKNLDKSDNWKIETEFLRWDRAMPGRFRYYVQMSDTQMRRASGYLYHWVVTSALKALVERIEGTLPVEHRLLQRWRRIAHK